MIKVLGRLVLQQNSIKFVWGEVGQFVVRSLNYGFEQGQLSVTQRQGVITCLPKGDKPRQFLQNWRPITLLMEQPISFEKKYISKLVSNKF